jgi:hypothetical protein
MHVSRIVTIATVLSAAVALPQHPQYVPPKPAAPPPVAGCRSANSTAPIARATAPSKTGPAAEAGKSPAAILRRRGDERPSEAPLLPSWEWELLPRHRRRRLLNDQKLPDEPAPRRRVRDPGNFALRQVYALIAGILAGTGTGVGAFGVAYMSGGPAAVIIGSGLAVGVGAGALTLMLLHNAAVKLNVKDDRGDVGVAAAATGGGGDDLHGQVVVELARLAAAVGLKFRILRQRNDDELRRAEGELLATFRPLSWQQLNDIL